MEKKRGKAQWVMPEWMKPYEQFIYNTGGNPIEELMNDTSTTPFNNAVRMTLIHCASSQVAMLTKLYVEGKLKDGPER